MGRHVIIAVPAYAGTVHLETMRSLLGDCIALTKRGDRFSIDDESGSSLIGQARSLIVARFLAIPDATDLVFIDHDVSWEDGALLRLLDHPVDFVAGAYRQRKDPEGYSIAWDQTSEDLVADPETGLLEVHGVPTGFLRLTRASLERMIECYPDTLRHLEAAPHKRFWHLFGELNIGVLMFGEDMGFCRRWRDIGGKVWLDPEFLMGHTGNKTFTGRLGDWLRARSG